jgi:hypothetical protein
MLRSLTAFVVALALCVAPSAFEPREPHDFLRAVGGMSQADLAALERGEPVARVLDTERREVAVVGAVRIKAPRARLIARYRDVENLKRMGVSLELGPFGEPATADDLRPLKFEEYDLSSVRECVPGDCPVRLSDTGMTRFRSTVDWDREDWGDTVSTIWRDLLAGLVTAYRERGDRSLPEYHNKQEPLRVQEEFRLLYERSAYVGRLVPEAFRYARDYPAMRLDGASDIFYWSKEDFGLKPVTSITHLMVYDPPAPKHAVVAAKRVYATHYFDAGLGLTLAMDDEADGFYMVSLTRARTRSLMSPFRAVVRGIVRNRSRDAMQALLSTTKASLEGQESASRK